MLCYTKPGDDPSNWKITLPRELIIPTVTGITKSQVTQEARGFMNKYPRDTIIVTYEDTLTTSTVTFVRGIS